MNHKTTKAHFEYFRKRFLKWTKRLSLNEWEWIFFHEEGENFERAWVRFKVGDRISNVCLGLVWETKPTKSVLDRCALHEALEMVNAPLLAEAAYRSATQEDIDAANHSAIRRLEHFILEVDRK